MISLGVYYKEKVPIGQNTIFGQSFYFWKFKKKYLLSSRETSVIVKVRNIKLALFDVKGVVKK